ncbi:MAG TPA: lauroyl acyltransferase, partial [Campylobacter avium]|nr:lauroyl acyltransferase [Campylobacter avium]
MKKSDFLYLFLYYLLKAVFKILPKRLIKKLANLIAKIAFKLNKKHRKIIDVNLSICFPNKTKKQRDEISLKIYENFAKFGLDFLANQNINKDEIQKKVQVED